ncbi:unnamed protein product [Rotaria magnacalcarata]|uniref:Uncharacterized protein n=1 Tax=Rotaria magnacalcarata TaxID=392030 RepID=A0A816KKS9_9BILA|nr:unnamed protein product [Rotaria magnacalcarata]CAF4429805.1 unnamed protein product [Rotaria magnacalcarata]
MDPIRHYFPGVTIESYMEEEDLWKFEDRIPSCCELIVSPEDMTECPLPDGYKHKSILMSKLNPSTDSDSLVAYPYSAYLVGDDVQDFIYAPRNQPSATFLHDFINDHHIEISLNIHDHQLKLTKESGGFPFSIDNQTSVFTISFAFHISDNDSNDNCDILLFTLQAIEQHASQERSIKIYLGNKICQTINVAFDNHTMGKFNFNFLPHISVGMKNFAIRKYAFSEEHIERLFISGLSYVAIDYKQQSKYRLEANTFPFRKDQQHFPDEFLIQFNEPFNEMK